MSDPVTLLVPSEERYRQLASDVARKFMDIAGGSASDASALAGDVEAAVARLAAEGGGADVQLAFRIAPTAIEIHLRCAHRSAVVTKPVPAKESR